MKNVFIVLCAALAACVGDDDGPGTSATCGDGVIAAGEQCDDGNATADDGCTACVRDSDVARVIASWRFKDLASNTITGCPAGYDVVTVYMYPVDAADKVLGPAQFDLFDCEAGTGASHPLTPGRYGVGIRVTETVTATVYADSLGQFVDVTTADAALEFEIVNDGGYFYIAIISIYGAMTEQSLSCAGAGATTIAVEAIGATSSTTTVVPCEDRFAFTSGLPEGEYTLRVSARDAADQIVGVSSDMPGWIIYNHNTVSWVDSVAIPIPSL